MKTYSSRSATLRSETRVSLSFAGVALACCTVISAVQADAPCWGPYAPHSSPEVVIPQQFATIGSAHFGPGQRATRVCVAGNIVFIANERLGIVTVDCSDKTHPKVIAKFDAPPWANDVFFRDGFLFVAANREGLAVLDVHNPSTPKLLSKLALEGYAQAVRVAGDYAYVACDGLQVIDISNPSAPKLVATAPSKVAAWDLLVNDRFAYLATRVADGGMSALQVVDVTDPRAPIQRDYAKANTYEYMRGLCLTGHLVCAAVESDGMALFDVSHPDAPTLLGKVAPSHGADFQFIAGEGTRVTAVGSACGLNIADVAVDSSVTFINRIDSDRLYQGIAMDGGLIYVVEQGGSLHIMKDLASEPGDARTGVALGRIYARKRTDIDRGNEYYLFVDVPVAADFPQFAGNPPEAFRFAKLSAQEVSQPDLKMLRAGSLAVPTRMVGASDSLRMDRLPRLRKVFAERIAGKDLYDLQASRTALVSALSDAHKEFVAEYDRLRGLDVVFLSHCVMSEQRYDFASETIEIDLQFPFLPPADERVGWHYAEFSGPGSPLKVKLPAALAKAAFSAAAGDVGLRIVSPVIEYHVALDGGVLESVSDRMISFKIREIAIRLESLAAPREIVVRREGAGWGQEVR